MDEMTAVTMGMPRPGTPRPSSGRRLIAVTHSSSKSWAPLDSARSWTKGDEDRLFVHLDEIGRTMPGLVQAAEAMKTQLLQESPK
jgi:hypothetical protein